MSWTRTYLSRLPARSDLPKAIRELRRGDQLRREVERCLDKWNLSWAQFDNLKYLHETEERIGTRTGKSKLGDGLPRRVEKLEDKGYVERKKHPMDGRKKVIIVTDEGKRTLREATSALADLVA